MSTIKTLIAEAREALESDRTAVQLDTLAGKLKTCIRERGERLKAITAKDTSTFGNTPGPERQKIVESGDIAALRRLDDAERELGPQLSVLHGLQDKLRRRLDEQRATEYIEAMPQGFQELDKRLADLAEAQKVAHKQRQALDALLAEIRQQKNHIIRQAQHGQKLELPAASPELLALYMRINGFSFHRSPTRTGWFSPTAGGPQQLRQVADALGLPVPQPGRESVAA